MQEPVTLTPIGVIRSPFTSLAGMPIQPGGARDVLGRLELDPALAPGLADLDGFSHIYILYVFHASAGYAPTVVPYLDNTPRGLFATRAPRRPNPLGLSVSYRDCPAPREPWERPSGTARACSSKAGADASSPAIRASTPH